MIPLELRLSGVRAFGNHVIDLGGPEVREIVMFGPNGSGKSTIARMIQALMGDVPDDLQQSFLDERDSKVNRRATAELTVLNPRGDEMWNPDWPERITLGLEFGYENNRSFSRYYTVSDGKQRQTYRTHEEYAAMFRRPPFNIKPDDRFMFIQQGESAALVQMRPRQRYETMKQFLGLEDLEKQWQETLDAKERALRELREAAAKHDELEDGVRRKEVAANRLREYREFSQELSELERKLADDDLITLVGRLDRMKREEERLVLSLQGENSKRDSLRGEVECSRAQIARLELEISAAEEALVEAKARHSRANEDRNESHRSVEELEGTIGSLERLASEGMSLEALAATGSSETVARHLEEARSSLKTAREAEFAAQEERRRCERILRTLEENHTALPAEAVAARDNYLAQGTPAMILGDAVAPQDDATLDERRAIEGALGELRWAVLVGDGRVLVDYREYTLADFGAAGTGHGAESHPSGLPVTCLSRVRHVGEVPPCLSRILDGVLSSVVFADDHAAAALWASRGFTAYTPDGYRYDRSGRKYSVPTGLCLGQTAYETALREARDALERAKRGEEQAARARMDAEKTAQDLQDSFRLAADAEASVTRVESRLPGAIAESARLDEECGALASSIDALAASITHMRIDQALLKKDADDIRRKIESVRKLADLPALKQKLVSLKERESAARRAAETALEEVRALEERKESAHRGKSLLEFDVQRAEERLSDLIPRIADLEHDLEERRRDVRDLEASAGAIVDRWRKTLGKPEIPDEDALACGRNLLSQSAPASQTERARWMSRIAELRPTVESLKDDVIPTAEEDYLSAKREFDKAESQLRRVEEAFRDASEKETAAQVNFKKVMQETFGRVSSRFQGYLDKFGWTGYLRAEPVQGTQFELQIYLSVYEGTEPRPLLRNRSGGETSAVAALLTLAMVKEYRRPFYIFDEIDQSLDPANVIKLAAILREELDRKYIVISHRLNKTHLEQGQFGIGVYRSQNDGSRTRVYRRKDWSSAS